MGQIEVRRAGDIEPFLQETGRQYLAGMLERPQGLAHVPDGEVEVGLSDYREDTVDKAHVHPVVREYQYVIAGRMLIREIDTGAVHELRAGDFYIIDRHTPYVLKAYAGTRVFFFKVPGGNDKQLVELGPEDRAWLDSV